MTDEVPSPCIGAARGGCRLAGDLCQGCFRRLEEIAAWPEATPEERRAILGRASLRRARRLEEQ